MRKDGNAGGHECLDLRGDNGTAFQFYGLRAGFDESACVGHGLLRRAIGVDGKVGDNDGFLRSARHGRSVPNHVIEGDRRGIRVAQHDHAERVADKDEVYS